MPTRTKTRWGVHAALIVVCFVMCIPALYALQLATLTFDAAFRAPPQLFPPGADLGENVSSLFTRLQFGGLMVNTTVVALVVVVGKTGLSLLAGLAFVYFQFPGKTVLFFVVLLTLLMPTEIILLPLFRMMSELEWGRLNPRLALTVPFLASATGVFLFRQHFANIPRELAEAAQLDGATPSQFLLSVLIPMSWNVIGAQALIQFISTWNAYLWPVLIVQDSSAFVIQMGVRSAASSGGQTDFGLLMAAGVIASLPPLILFVLLQRQFMNGFALTRDK
ncbi:MAG: carbohydrate ABC transporter permease [Anaerolineae bacterium]|jgi:sn-glycerol 3-phosphate transport system permease protein|nr:carbohydrate ABC transporter permease [Anaerolineae bacterium]